MLITSVQNAIGKAGKLGTFQNPCRLLPTSANRLLWLCAAEGIDDPEDPEAAQKETISNIIGTTDEKTQIYRLKALLTAKTVTGVKRAFSACRGWILRKWRPRSAATCQSLRVWLYQCVGCKTIF